MNADLASRVDRYSELVRKRKSCSLCAGHLQNASRIDNGLFDSERIGPYSQWQGNLHAPLVVVAQDFSDIAGFRQYGGWPGHNIQTNRNLIELLACAGYNIAPFELGTPDDRLFFTNAVLCMKSGDRAGRQQNVPVGCFSNCGSFLKATIELVSPRVVVTLGASALSATRQAFGLTSRQPLSHAVGVQVALASSIQLVALYHPSPTVVNTHRSMNSMRADWSRLAPLLGSDA